MQRIDGAPGAYAQHTDERPAFKGGVNTSTCVFYGITEWGPIGDPTLVEGDFGNWQPVFGRRLAYSDLAYCCDNAFKVGSKDMYVVRQAKLNETQTDLHASIIKSGLVLTSDSVVATGAELLGIVAPRSSGGWQIPRETDDNNATFEFDDAATTTYTANLVAHPAVLTASGLAASFAASSDSFTFRTESGGYTTTVSIANGTATQQDVVDAINAQLTGASAELDTNTITVTSDIGGTAAYVECVSCTSNLATYMSWTAPLVGTPASGSNVADSQHVTLAEIKVVIEAAASGVVTVNASQSPERFNMTTVATGTAATLTFDNTSTTDVTRAVFGIPNTAVGTNGGAATDCMTVSGKYYGLRGNDIMITTTDNPTHKSLSPSADLASAITAGDSELVAVSKFGYYVGQVLKLDDGSNSEWVKVTGIRTVVTGGTPVYTVVIESEDTTTGVFLNSFATSNTSIVSKEFDLNVSIYPDTDVVEHYAKLSVNPDDSEYFVTVINDSYRGSKWIEVASHASATSFATQYPEETGLDFLTGATSELETDNTVLDVDKIGVLSARTGIYAIHSLRNKAAMCAAPNSKAIVQRAFHTYLESRQDMFFMGTIPESDMGFSTIDTKELAEAWRIQNGFDTKNGQVAFPRGEVDDPEGSGASPQREIDLSGHLVGLRAVVDGLPSPDGGVHEASAGTGQFGTLPYVNKLSYDIDQLGDGTGRNSELGELNDAGIVCIIMGDNDVPVVWGTRSLSSEKKWMFSTTCRFDIYIMNSILRESKDVIFRGNDPRWWSRIDDILSKYLGTAYADGALRSDLTPSDAYYFKTGNDGLVSAQAMEEGYQYAEYGYYPRGITEKIIYTVNNMSGQVVTVTQ